MPDPDNKPDHDKNEPDDNNGMSVFGVVLVALAILLFVVSAYIRFKL
jgi:hypothetical protein